MNFEFKNFEDLDCKSFFTLPFSGKCGMWFDDSGNIVGIIKTKGLDCENPTNIYIELFEVKYKYKGFGVACIKDIFERYECLERIEGESKEGVEYFWEYLGAFFINCCEDCEDFNICESDGYACDNTTSSSFFLLRDDIM